MGTNSANGHVNGKVIIVAQQTHTPYDNVGISNDGNPSEANFDGDPIAVDSYSQQALNAAGLSPGATVVHDGIDYAWPDPTAGTPDNYVASGQTIHITGSGTRLGILAAADDGTATGPVTVTYTDGTTSTASITVANWHTNQAATGSDILVTTPSWDSAGNGPHPVSVYATSIPIDPSKTIASVTLPDISAGIESGLTLHVFALGIAASAASPPPTHSVSRSDGSGHRHATGS